MKKSKTLRILMKKRWFNISILLGIFVMLVRPTMHVPQSVQPNQVETSGRVNTGGLSKLFFQDIHVSEPLSQESQPVSTSQQPMNTVSYSDEEQKLEDKEIMLDGIEKLIDGEAIETIVLSPMIDAPRMRSIAKELEYNKEILIRECVRIEPRLKPKKSLFGLGGNDGIPDIYFILSSLEEDIGEQYLYNDIGKGAKLVFKYIERVSE